MKCVGVGWRSGKAELLLLWVSNCADDGEVAASMSGVEALEVPEKRLGAGEFGERRDGEGGVVPCGPVI